jgi:hypothetical protein
MPDIDRLSHTLPSVHQPPKISRPPCDPMSGEEEKGTDDDRTLVDVIRSKKTSASPEGAISPSGNSLPESPEETPCCSSESVGLAPLQG